MKIRFKTYFISLAGFIPVLAGAIWYYSGKYMGACLWIILGIILLFFNKEKDDLSSDEKTITNSIKWLSLFIILLILGLMIKKDIENPSYYKSKPETITV